MGHSCCHHHHCHHQHHPSKHIHVIVNSMERMIKVCTVSIGPGQKKNYPDTQWASTFSVFSCPHKNISCLLVNGHTMFLPYQLHHLLGTVFNQWYIYIYSLYRYWTGTQMLCLIQGNYCYYSTRGYLMSVSLSRRWG